MSTFTPQEFVELHINHLEYHKFVLTADGHVAVRVLGGAGGDMLKSVYDPNLIEGDVFDMDNMQEGSNTKIMTAAERTKLGIALVNTDIVTTATAGKLWDAVKINTEIGNINSSLTTLIGTKENAFAKNTGFNKNFGTTAGTVSEGNHTHDDRYFTETEVTNLIANAKAEAITQAKNDITGGAAAAYDTLLEIQNQLQSDDTDIAGILTSLGNKVDKVASQSEKFARWLANGNLEAIDPTTTMVAEGTNLYFTTARVLATALTGFSATNSAITATDTVLKAFNKAQGQISVRALDSDVVKLTGDQSIGGNKTFTGSIRLPVTGGNYIFDVNAGTQARLYANGTNTGLWIGGFNAGISLNNITLINTTDIGDSLNITNTGGGFAEGTALRVHYGASTSNRYVAKMTSAYGDLFRIQSSGEVNIDGKFLRNYKTDTSANTLRIVSRYELSSITHSNMGHILQFIWGGLIGAPEGTGNDGGWGLEFGPHGNTYIQCIAETTRIGRRGGNLDTMGVLRHYGYATGTNHIALWNNGTYNMIESVGQNLSFGTTSLVFCEQEVSPFYGPRHTLTNNTFAFKWLNQSGEQIMSLSGGKKIWMYLTTTAGTSGELYKDANGFVKIVA